VFRVVFFVSKRISSKAKEEEGMSTQKKVEICVIQVVFRLNLEMGHTTHNVADLIESGISSEAPRLFQAYTVSGESVRDFDPQQSSSIGKAVVLDGSIKRSPSTINGLSISRADYHALQRWVCAVAKIICQERVRVRIGNVEHHWDANEC